MSRWAVPGSWRKSAPPRRVLRRMLPRREAIRMRRLLPVPILLLRPGPALLVPRVPIRTPTGRLPGLLVTGGLPELLAPGRLPELRAAGTVLLVTARPPVLLVTGLPELLVTGRLPE